MKKDITYSDLMKELDKYRPAFARQIDRLSDEQVKFLITCREHSHPITYPVMCELWEKLGWGKTTDTSMRRYYDKVKKSGL